MNPRGKASLTEFRPIQYFSKVTLIEALPVSGRTHQIRVHAQYAGHPIIGDDKYGDKTMNKAIQHLGCARLFLHASRLHFPNR
ncbi:pseudouridine synthase [Rickettsiella massiliensis]|uniref:pseudouridine synthase n=1 Tax=Rickettsiella massiliensis TaxID=676517 RepID=UPI00029A6A5F|nr:RNA pseudouridine synthase [Rickettsiella massiliensis]